MQTLGPSHGKERSDNPHDPNHDLVGAGGPGLLACGVRVEGVVWVRGPRAMLLRRLSDVFGQVQWGVLPRRRQDFAQVPMPDFRAVARAVGGIRGADRAATVSAVLAGSSVPQTVAPRWVGYVGCPRCGAAEETWQHRFWECPYTPSIRPETGVVADAGRGAGSGGAAAPERDGVVVCTDGSAFEVDDPVLCRAA